MNTMAHFRTWVQSFTGMTDEAFSVIENSFQIKTINTKQILIDAGQTCNGIAYIRKGLFRAYYFQNEKEINAHFFLENEFVMDFDFFMQQKPSNYFFQAMEDSEIVFINLNALQNAFANSPNWEQFKRIMAEASLRKHTNRYESLLILKPKQRYFSILKNEPKLLERVPLLHIASYIGIEPDRLKRLQNKIATKRRN